MALLLVLVFYVIVLTSLLQYHIGILHIQRKNAIQSTSSFLTKNPSFITSLGLQSSKNAIDCENKLTEILESQQVKGRGAKSSGKTIQSIESLIKELEDIGQEKNKEIPPITSKLLDGCWKLLYTSSPGTNSPIQRTFTAIDQGVNVFQVVNIVNPNKNGICESYLGTDLPEVSNTICFGDLVRLRITALASTTAKPIIEPRKNDGRIFGLNIFGISSTEPPRDPKERIDFAFQEARFEFKKFPNLIIPYPVPFKLLGDEAKGLEYPGNPIGFQHIAILVIPTVIHSHDTSTNDICVSRGNKGTIFLLKKIDDWNIDPIAKLAVMQMKSTSRKNSTNTATLTSSSITTLKSRTTSIPSKVTDKTVSSQNSGLVALLNWNPFSVSSTKQNSSSSRKPKEKNRSIIIFPAQLGTENDYKEFKDSITKITGSTYDGRIFITPLNRIDWIIGLLPSFFSIDYFQGTLKPDPVLKFYFNKADEAVKQALVNDPETELLIIGHSIGGWIARAWLSEWMKSNDIKSRVKALITLGSPHRPPPSDTPYSKIDQTRGLLTYINDNYPGTTCSSIYLPFIVSTDIVWIHNNNDIVTVVITNIFPNTIGAYEKDIQYISVIGKSMKGNLGNLSLESLLAYGSYTVLSGNGTTDGDGIIPIDASILTGAKTIILDDVKHSNYLPLPGDSLKLPFTWYGSEDALMKWLKEVD